MIPTSGFTPAEQLATRRARSARGPLGSRLTGQSSEFLEVLRAGAAAELRPGSRFVRDEPLAPAFEFVLPADAAPVLCGDLLECFAYGFHVHASHQLADVLALADARTVAGYAPRRIDGRA